ncbi:MAG: penicillin-insensitive murein endopeptidase [Proteobacteria bacterium]|nr:penicillin-insensitive murein endopeptidase [Pseudomonadota bacterium]
MSFLTTVGRPSYIVMDVPKIIYTYDANHRLESVADSRGSKTLFYSYSPGGLLNRMSDSDGNRTDYKYDPVGRLSGIYAPNNDYVAFRYDDGGRLAEKWLSNGVNTQYTYNPDNSLAKVVNLTSSSSVISQHDYTYDPFGNRQTHTEQIGSTNTPYKYIYDALNRLTEVWNNSNNTLKERYGYDPLGNRKTKTDGTNIVYYVYDAANQLNSIRQGSENGAVVVNLHYDYNGNMDQKTEDEGTTVTDITYDALNRLTQVNKTGQSTQTYAYDDQGRRISKTVGASTTNFLYNGPDIIAEYTNWTTAAAQYTHGPNMDDPIIRTAGTAKQYYHQDGLGSVVAVSDQTGATTGTQRFDAWGNKIAGSGTIPQYGYTGREPDETGLIYYRARYYDPTIGRFTQRDPIGMNGGINPYAYVNANPVNFTDPMGLMAESWQINNNTQNTNYYNNTSSDTKSFGNMVADALKAGLESDSSTPEWYDPSMMLAGGKGTPAKGKIAFKELPVSGYGFYTYGREDGHFGQEKTIESIKNIGESWSNICPEYQRIGVGNISLESGGKFLPHSSHQNGQDVDVRPMRNDWVESNVSYKSPYYSQELTQGLVNILLKNPNIDKILFNDPGIKGVQPYKGHDNHLHIHFKK